MSSFADILDPVTNIVTNVFPIISNIIDIIKLRTGINTYVSFNNFLNIMKLFFFIYLAGKMIYFISYLEKKTYTLSTRLTLTVAIVNIILLISIITGLIDYLSTFLIKKINN
jgi:hypothetical protein